MSLRIRLLRSPASLDIGDAEGGIPVSVQQAGDLHSYPLHFFHCQQGQQFIRRHDHIIRDTLLHDMIDASVRDDIPYNISVTIEPLVRLLSIPDPLASAQDSPDKQGARPRRYGYFGRGGCRRGYHALHRGHSPPLLCPHDPCRSLRSQYRGQSSRSMSERPRCQRR